MIDAKSKFGILSRVIIVAGGVIVWVLISKVWIIPTKESAARSAAYKAEVAKLNQQEKDRIQTERERIVSQIEINKAIVGHADKGE